MRKLLSEEFSSIQLFFSPKLLCNRQFLEAESLCVTVSASDIPEKKEPKQNFLLSDLNLKKEPLVLKNIPTGKYRFVTVKTFHKNKKEYLLVRALCEIKKGNKNKIEVSEEKCAFANVLYGIKNIFDFDELEKDGRMDTVRAVIDESIPYYLFDSAKLIGELSGFSFPYHASKEDYRLKCGSVTFDYLLAEDFTVRIDDPLSFPLTHQSPRKGIVLNGIVPGSRTLSIFDKDGNLLEQNEVHVESGKNKNLSHLEHDGIAILVETSEHPIYDFKGEESVSFNFEGKTYEINKKGVYLLKNGSLIPLSKSGKALSDIKNLSITEEHLKKCFIDDPEKERFVVLFSEKLYGKKVSSVKAYFNKGINDHDGAYAGEHISMARDKRGFFYGSVSYDDVQQTNQSGQPSYNFKVDGQIIEPPDFVDTGYIYQKFAGSTPLKKFLVLIYSSQDEKEITNRFSNEKKCLTLADFDLSTEKGQKQIANFRLVPGTTNLFRSYHPYGDDKANISDTSKKRMEYVALLSEKAGIKSDINLSDEKVTSVTYKMPEYYQKIIDSKKVLYMTDCGYDVCYSGTDSKKFGNGIKKIVEFINRTEGPYQIHCRIGTDRTGVICAVLSLLCGASWKEAEEDYCASSGMGIYEYRGPGAIKYAIQHLLGDRKLEEIPDLQKAVKDYFTQNGYLAKEQIAEMINRLQKKGI